MPWVELNTAVFPLLDSDMLAAVRVFVKHAGRNVRECVSVDSSVGSWVLFSHAFRDKCCCVKYMSGLIAEIQLPCVRFRLLESGQACCCWVNAID